MWRVLAGTDTLIVKFGEPIVLKSALRAMGCNPLAWQQHAASADGVVEVGMVGRGEEKEEREREAELIMTRAVAALAHRTLDHLNRETVVTPTNLVAMVLLTLSCRGISLSDLVEHVLWLQVRVLGVGFSVWGFGFGVRGMHAHVHTHAHEHHTHTHTQTKTHTQKHTHTHMHMHTHRAR
jgi:hypothetical protein